MAINILGKFLSNKDNNIRYVALNTLNKVVTIDTNAVQRHRNIILDCLRDSDISIRRRALELSYALINESNVRILIRELLAFLEVADNEFKLGMTTQISLAAERFAPNKRWHIDTVLRVLKLAGNYVREEILSAFIRLVAHTPELQAYTASKLYTSLKSDISQESLTLAATWVIGEYSEVLLQGGLVDEDTPKPITDAEILDLIISILDSPYANFLIRQFVLAAITKMSSRPTTSSAQQDRISTLITGYATNPELEIQQRSVEFANLLSLGELKSGVLERMPAPELKATVMGYGNSEDKPVGSTQGGDLLGGDDIPGPSSDSTGIPQVAASNTQNLLDEIFGSSPATELGSATQPPAPATSASPPPKPRNAIDDILGLFPNSAPTPSANPINTTVPALGGLGSGLTSPTYGVGSPVPTPIPQSAFSLPQTQSPPQQSPQLQKLTAYTAYEKNGLKVTLTPQTSPNRPGVVNILARFQVTGPSAASGISFQVAVPKNQQLQMLAMSNPNVNPGGVETQQMQIKAPVGSQLRLRLRISYLVNGQQIQDQVDFSGFPPNLMTGG